MSKLKKQMKIKKGVEFEFVVVGQTRWYSHLGQILSIFKAKSSLQAYKEEVECETGMKTDKQTAVLDVIGAASYWQHLQLI